MPGSLGDLFGGKSKTETTRSFLPPTPFDITTPFGGLFAGPSSRGGQFGAGALGGPFSGITGGFRGSPLSAGLTFNEDIPGQIVSDIELLRSLENPFVQARVNPLRRRLDEQIGGVERGFQRRGVFGSIPANTLFGLQSEAGRRVGEAGALATAESQNAIFQRQQFFLASALRAAGLSLDAIKTVLASRSPSGTISETEDPAKGFEAFGTFLGGIGGFL